MSTTEVHHATVKVIKDGRITIPSDIRELEGIKEGDFLKITIQKIERNKNELN
jgi:AbrB family looped-hinge helix DNA binding protein